jgi:hypothetical protein
MATSTTKWEGLSEKLLEGQKVTFAVSTTALLATTMPPKVNEVLYHAAAREDSNSAGREANLATGRHAGQEPVRSGLGAAMLEPQAKMI